MNKNLLVLILIQVIVCQSCFDNQLREKPILKKENTMNGGVVTYYMLNGQIEGECLEYDKYNNLISQSFYKCGEQDSLFLEFYPNQNIKTIAYYWRGIQNGRQLYFDETGQILKDYFYENDKLKVAGYTEIMDSSNNVYSRKYYKSIAEDTLEFIGELVGFSGTTSLFSKHSNYYLLLNDSSYIREFQLGSGVELDFEFYPSYSSSSTYVQLGDLNERHQLIDKTVKKYYLDSNNIFRFKHTPTQRGWHKIRGVFYEENDKFEEPREIPIYYNYYVE